MKIETPSPKRTQSRNILIISVFFCKKNKRQMVRYPITFILKRWYERMGVKDDRDLNLRRWENRNGKFVVKHDKLWASGLSLFSLINDNTTENTKAQNRYFLVFGYCCFVSSLKPRQVCYGQVM